MGDFSFSRGMEEGSWGALFFISSYFHLGSQIELNNEGWTCNGLPINLLQDGVFNHRLHIKFKSTHNSIS